MIIFDDYLSRVHASSDIAEHLPLLFSLAFRTSRIVEFGVRSGNSTIAFLAAHEVRAWTSRECPFLFSYDRNPPDTDLWEATQSLITNWQYIQADTSSLETIPECDLLFIDTLHTENQVTAELAHSQRVRRWIVLHDTELFGERGEGGGNGINFAIRRFLLEHPEWTIWRDFGHNNGLVVIERKHE